MRETREEVQNSSIRAEDGEPDKDDRESQNRPLQSGPETVPGLELFGDVHRTRIGCPGGTFATSVSRLLRALSHTGWGVTAKDWALQGSV
jgi:hypothetical protein